MQPKYKYFELKNAKALPTDVNIPIIRLLSGSWPVTEVTKVINEHEKRRNFGGIDVIDKKTGKRIILSVQSGIIDGCDLVETIDTGRFFIHDRIHIKNENVDFKKERKT
jgi:hypothetical protein